MIKDSKELGVLLQLVKARSSLPWGKIRRLLSKSVLCTKNGVAIKISYLQYLGVLPRNRNP
jgi:hypothetical protein